MLKRIDDQKSLMENLNQIIIILNIKKALEFFHNNLQKNFYDNKVKDDI